MEINLFKEKKENEKKESKKEISEIKEELKKINVILEDHNIYIVEKKKSKKFKI